MATHDYVLANQSGSSFRTDLNNALSAVVSNNSNATEPSTKYAYELWADTNSGYLKIRNAANNAWVSLFKLDGTDLANICRLTGSTNNQITTVTAANAIQGEANLTFDGSTLDVNGTAKIEARRQYAGQTDTGGSGNWWKIGTISTFGGGNAAKITILGTNSYGPDDNISGETTIILRRDNGTRLRGYFYGSGTTNSYLTIADVATKATSNSSEFDIYVLPGGHYQNIAAFVDISSGAATWTDAPSDTGSGTQPASSYALQKDWVLKTGGVDRLKVDSTGGVTIKDGDLVIGTSGHGIDFSAVSHAAGMTSETLDSYEEGTWTPAFDGYSSPTGVFTYNGNNGGKYTKIGNQVTIWFYVAISNMATLPGGGYLTLKSLPFTNGGGSGIAEGASVVINWWDPIGSGLGDGHNLVGFVQNGQNRIIFGEQTEIGIGGFSPTQFFGSSTGANGSYMYGCATYLV